MKEKRIGMEKAVSGRGVGEEVTKEGEGQIDYMAGGGKIKVGEGEMKWEWVGEEHRKWVMMNDGRRAVEAERGVNEV